MCSIYSIWASWQGQEGITSIATDNKLIQLVGCVQFKSKISSNRWLCTLFFFATSSSFIAFTENNVWGGDSSICVIISAISGWWADAGRLEYFGLQGALWRIMPAYTLHVEPAQCCRDNKCDRLSFSDAHPEAFFWLCWCSHPKLWQHLGLPCVIRAHAFSVQPRYSSFFLCKKEPRVCVQHCLNSDRAKPACVCVSVCVFWCYEHHKTQTTGGGQGGCGCLATVDNDYTLHEVAATELLASLVCSHTAVSCVCVCVCVWVWW